MKLLAEHLPISMLLGCLGYVFSGNLYCILGALLAGWCINMVHPYNFILFTLECKKLDFECIKSGEYFNKNDKIIIPLHLWEITCAFIVIGLLSKKYACIFFTAAIAHGTHLTQDQLVYRTRILGYSIISRMFSNFNYKRFCRVIND